MGYFKDTLKAELLKKRMFQLENQRDTLIDLLAEHEKLLREYSEEYCENYSDDDDCTNL